MKLLLALFFFISISLNIWQALDDDSEKFQKFIHTGEKPSPCARLSVMAYKESGHKPQIKPKVIKAKTNSKLENVAPDNSYEDAEYRTQKKIEEHAIRELNFSQQEVSEVFNRIEKFKKKYDAEMQRKLDIELKKYPDSLFRSFDADDYIFIGQNKKNTHAELLGFLGEEKYQDFMNFLEESAHKKNDDYIFFEFP